MDPRRSKVTLGSSLGLGALLFAAACQGTLGGSNPVEQQAEEEQLDVSNDVNGTQLTTVLDQRVLSFADAYRTASIKLTDRLPTLQTIRDFEKAEDKKVAYHAAIDAMFESNDFKRRMLRFARDTFRQGGGQGGQLDTAPAFLARILVEGRPFSELFTATSNNCPTFDGDTNSFVDGTCASGVPVEAGVLTNPGTMKHFNSSMAFRRVRWVQEMFACTKFPAEYSAAPVDMGAGQFTSPWPFESIATAPIDFQDTSAVVCANCHTTMNHLAPLFGHFDANGMWKNDLQVMTPTAPDPQKTQLSHWLKDGETTAWRLGQPVKDLAELGQAMAADPEVKSCLVARLWNLTMSKEDIVSDLATVPTRVVQTYIDQLDENGGNLRDTLKSMFKSEDFTRF
ncbi:MAG: DUF1588 domain-containing protein [Deltaproteobacteria bacterium]|nr:DUF1588 domain-containing protein [Deltaproteobacteria bacterium]